MQKLGDKKTVKNSDKTLIPDHVSEMQTHYNETGSFRSSDVFQVLGDPSRCVEVAAKPAAASNHRGLVIEEF